MPDPNNATMADPFPLHRVLVIDDDPVSLSLTALLLEAEEMQVKQCCSGEEACGGALLDGWMPDLVLADLRMPGLSGSALAEEMTRCWPGACLVAISAAAPEPVDGYAAVLQKPLPMDGLRTLLEAIHRKRSDGGVEPPKIQSGNHDADQWPALDEELFEKLKQRMHSAALQEFLNVMLADAGSRIEKIRVSLDAGDTAAAKLEAHTLRGSAGMVGAVALKTIAQKIETNVDSLDDLKRDFARLEVEHERLSVILASKLL